MAISYIIYVLTVLFATWFASLAQKYSKPNKKGVRTPNRIFWFVSMGILFFVMGLRANTVGVDDLNYLRGYNVANSLSVLEYYSNFTTEPGFYLLYRIVYVIFDDFQWLIILTSLITIILFYKAIAYEIDNISLSLAVFIFASTQYFYYFGIIRMGMSVAIIAVAYRYILENRKKKFVFLVAVATLFHYSALFALIVIFIKPNSSRIIKNSTLIKIAVIIPLAFITVRFIAYPFISASRYSRYVQSSGIIGWSFISSLPFLLLFALHYNKLKFNVENSQFYFMLFVIKIVTEIFAPVIGIGRMVWYVNLSMVYLLPATVRINSDKMMKVILVTLIVLYCVVYSYYAYFGLSHRGNFMLPYRNILF